MCEYVQLTKRVAYDNGHTITVVSAGAPRLTRLTE
jgi:hypothetical protein